MATRLNSPREPAAASADWRLIIGLLFIISSLASPGIWSFQAAGRPLGLVFVVAAVAGVRSRGTFRGTIEWLHAKSSSRRLMFGMVPALYGYLVEATIPHGLRRILYSYALSGFLLVLFLLAIRHIPHRTMQRSLFAALLLTCCASLVLGVVDPGLAARGGRLIGFTGSANTLGIFAFVLFALTLFVDVGLRIRIAAFASSLGCVVWSASRASAAAIVICLLGYLLLRKGLAAVFRP